jgi:hypothetical protein
MVDGMGICFGEYGAERGLGLDSEMIGTVTDFVDFHLDEDGRGYVTLNTDADRVDEALRKIEEDSDK